MTLSEFIYELRSAYDAINMRRSETDYTAHEVQMITEKILPSIRAWQPSQNHQIETRQKAIKVLESIPAQVKAYYAGYDYAKRKHPDMTLLWSSVVTPAQGAIQQVLDSILGNA